ncbi:MAG: glycosyltransferase [Pseudomonadota bacterium]
MRVLLTIPDLAAAAGGPPVLVTRLAAALREAGDEVVLMFGERPGVPQLAVPEGVTARVVAGHRNPWQRFRQFRDAVISTIETQRIEIVHDHGLWLPENAASAIGATRSARPWVAQPCGMLQDWSLQQQRLKKRLAWLAYQRRLIGRSAALIAASDSETRETAARLPAKLPVHCIAHGVDLPEISITAPRKRQAVFLGRLHPVKQVDVLLRSWAELAPQDWQLRIAGGGEPGYEAMLKALAASLGIGDAVQFLGPMQGEAKSALLSESQLFLQPSQQENFGLSVLEALAHGLPALTTQAMPWAQLPAVGCGWSVAPNAPAITATLGSALALPATQLAAMGALGREYASGYSWAATARATRLVYAQARA